MKLLAIFIIGFSSAFAHAGPCLLCGQWKSDESKTVQAMLAHEPALTPKQIEFFSNGFFGRLIHEFNEKEYRSYFTEDGPSAVEWLPYEAVQESPERIRVKSLDPDTRTWREDVLQVQGGCYVVQVAESTLTEYFCREREWLPNHSLKADGADAPPP